MMRFFVGGHNKYLEYNYGKDHNGHGWVEIGDYVYDPSLMLRFEKDVYYKLYCCSNVDKIDKETYLRDHKEFVDTYVSTDFDEFRPGGNRRLELGCLIIQIKALSGLLEDEEFTKDVNEYLSLVEYDENQIHEERQKALRKIFENKKALSIIGGNDCINVND